MEERNHIMLNQHAAEFGEGTASVRYVRNASVVTVTRGLPGSTNAHPWLLTFVQGFRHTIEYGLQAALLTARREARLVADADLLVHCNNAALSPTTLLRFVARYPHRRRVLLQSSDNSFGYRCGHLHAVASSRSVWQAYANVLFLHPDIYLLPRAVQWLEQSLAQSAATSAFLVTSMYWFSPAPGLPGSTTRSSTYYGTDLFAFRPPHLKADTWTRVCTVSASEPQIRKLPEHLLWRLINVDSRLPVRVLGNRTTSMDRDDNYGVWHSHEPDKVAKYLVDHHLVVKHGKG